MTEMHKLCSQTKEIVNENEIHSFVKSVKETLQWRHNEREGVSNHRRLDCFPNIYFRRRSKEISKLRFTGDRWIPLSKDQ